MKVTAVVDLQFGSTGKGLIAGYLSRNNEYDTVVCANMPNAGHTYVDEHGDKIVSKVLPSGVFSKNLERICIGPGAVFDVRRLVEEIETLRAWGISAPVIIHPHAAILMDHHREFEQATLSNISSTMQGSMAATINKLYRSPDSNVVAKHAGIFAGLDVNIVDHESWFNMMASSKNILMEGSQGYSLGINAGFYPYCTSRDCTVWRTIADCGVPILDRYALNVVGTARVHPIRVGNTADGHSGGHYRDQEETTWEALGQTPETTTVTGRIRRVFTFSELQIREAILANSVNEVFLNFCNYDPREANRVMGIINEIGASLREQVPWVDKFNMVKYLGFGPQVNDVIEVPAYG